MNLKNDNLHISFGTNEAGKLDYVSFNNNKDYSVINERMGSEDWFTEKNSFNNTSKISRIALADVLETAVTLADNEKRDLYINKRPVDKEAYSKVLLSVINMETGLTQTEKASLLSKLGVKIESIPIQKDKVKLGEGTEFEKPNFIQKAVSTIKNFANSIKEALFSGQAKQP